MWTGGAQGNPREAVPISIVVDGSRVSNTYPAEDGKSYLAVHFRNKESDDFAVIHKLDEGGVTTRQ